jgi:hypothetical protein
MRIDLQICAPQHVPFHLALAAGNPLLSGLFPLALHDAGLFRALIAMSNAYHEVRDGPGTQSWKEAPYHSASAITEVRNKLACPTGHQEKAVLLTIQVLMGIDVSGPAPKVFTEQPPLTFSVFAWQHHLVWSPSERTLSHRRPLRRP